jgi:hypothetical protein
MPAKQQQVGTMLGIAEGRDKAGDKITANFLRDLAGQDYPEAKPATLICG